MLTHIREVCVKHVSQYVCVKTFLILRWTKNKIEGSYLRTINEDLI